MLKLHLNPDHYLETRQGCLWTPERNKLAWEQLYSDFEQALIKYSKEPLVIYLVMGIQGSGKSTWIKQHQSSTAAIYIDATLPARRHRQFFIQLAQQYSVPINSGLDEYVFSSSLRA